jgi:hypothetical protein
MSAVADMRDDLRDLERRVVQHLDMRLQIRLALDQRSTIVWTTVMNSVAMIAVIAALRL